MDQMAIGANANWMALLNGHQTIKVLLSAEVSGTDLLENDTGCVF